MNDNEKISINKSYNKAVYYRYLYLKQQHDYGLVPREVVNENLAYYCSKHDQAICDAESLFMSYSDNKKQEIIASIRNSLSELQNNEVKKYFYAKKDVLLELLSSFLQIVEKGEISDLTTIVKR